MNITSILNAPCDIDAAVNWGDFTYLFKGDKLYRYSNVEDKFLDGPNSILTLNQKIGSHIDAAVQWFHNNKKYIFKGTIYYRTDGPTTNQQTVVSGWKGLFESQVFPKCGCGCTEDTIGDVFTEHWKYDSAEYEIALGKSSLLYKEMVEVIVNNTNKSITSERKFTVITNLNELTSFYYSHGMQPPFSTLFRVPIPNIKDGVINIDTNLLKNFSYGQSKMLVTNALSLIYTCPYFHNMKVACRVFLPVQSIVVPFRLNFHNKWKNCTCATEGLLHKERLMHPHISILQKNTDM